ncbi:MAG: hypothetical protein AM1032_000388 [Mycoplasmataceae bacterium]|nr:MAG: hypothetical protein AM1032_000388 [Mycoplasmataceae bacterium]
MLKTNENYLQNNSEEIKIIKVAVEPTKLIAFLSDGRELAIPRDWFKLDRAFNLKNVTDEQLKDYEITGLGETIYFPQVEEFLGLHTFTGGLKAPCV